MRLQEKTGADHNCTGCLTSLDGDAGRVKSNQ